MIKKINPKEEKKMTNLEQVEKLREKAAVSYDEAKEALEASGGDLLDALIYLEKNGKVSTPEGGGYYNSEKASEAPKKSAPKKKAQPERDSFGDLLRRFFRFCGMLIHKGNINSFEVIKDGQIKTAFPVTALVLLLVFVFWITLPLMVIGLFFGYSYRFRGPDLGKESVNEAMNSVAETAETLKKSLAGERETKE
jgi:hypothetical protein